MKLGLSGILTRAFINSPLTPLLLLAALVVGAVALVGLPREEEPQISVPMVDIMVTANGYKAGDAIELITRPLEDIVKGINGVEHVYSQTEDDRVVVTARFFVGTDEDTAVLRIHEKIRANIAGLPKGIPEPLIIGRGINDVAIVVLALAAAPGHADDAGPTTASIQVAEELLHELIKVENVGTSYIVGGSPNQIRVEPDPERLSLYGITLNQLVDKLEQCQPLIPGRHLSRARQGAPRARRPDPAGCSGHRAPAADLARRPAGLRQGRGQRRGRCGRARATRLDVDACVAPASSSSVRWSP